MELRVRDRAPMREAAAAEIGCRPASRTPSTFCYVGNSREACERAEKYDDFAHLKRSASVHGNVVTVARFCDNTPAAADALEFLRQLPAGDEFHQSVAIASPESVGLLRVATIDVTGLQLDLDIKHSKVASFEEATRAAAKIRAAVVRLADFSATPENDERGLSAKKLVQREAARISEALRVMERVPGPGYLLETPAVAQVVQDSSAAVVEATKDVTQLSLVKLAWVAHVEDVGGWMAAHLKGVLDEAAASRFQTTLESVRNGAEIQLGQSDEETPDAAKKRALECIRCVSAVQKYTAETLLPYLQTARPVAYVNPPPAWQSYPNWQTARTMLLGCDAPEFDTSLAADGDVGDDAGKSGSFANLLRQIEKSPSVAELTPEASGLLVALLSARSKRDGIPVAEQLYDSPKVAELARVGVGVCGNDCPFAIFAPRALHAQAWQRWALLPRTGTGFASASNCSMTQAKVREQASLVTQAIEQSRDVALLKSGDGGQSLVNLTLTTAKALLEAIKVEAGAGVQLNNVEVTLGPVVVRKYTVDALGPAWPEHAARLACAHHGASREVLQCFVFPETEVQRMVGARGEHDAPSATQAPMTPQLALRGKVRIPASGVGAPSKWVVTKEEDYKHQASDVASYSSIYEMDPLCGVRCLLQATQERIDGLAPSADDPAGKGLVPLGAHWTTPPVFVLAPAP